MYIVHVFAQVKPKCVAQFKQATLENAQASLKEPGIARFDVLQAEGDPSAFVLVEVYRTKEDTASHKETVHYHTWNETVADMMAVPRTKQIFNNVYPGEDGWL